MKMPLSFSRMPKMFRRMFWRNYLVYVLIVTLFTLIGSAWVIHTIVQRQRTDSVQIATGLAKATDQWLTECQQMSVSVGQIETLLELDADGPDEMDYSALDTVLLSQAQHALVAAGATRQNVAHLAVYLYNHEYVVTDTGTLELDDFYQTLFAAPSTPQSPYLRRLGPGKFLFLREGTVGNTVPEMPVYVTSVIDQHGKQYGNLFIFLDSRVLNQAQTEIAGENTYYSIFDADGNALFCSDSLFLPRDEFLAQLKTSGEQPVEYAVNNFSGWTVCAGTPVAFLHREIWALCFFLFLAWCGVLAGGSIGIMMLCRKNYAPISALARFISEQSAGVISQEMEYEALTTAISTITDRRKNAEEQLQIYKPVLINSLLMELLDGFQDQTVTLTALHALGCSFPYPFWQCTSVHGDGMRLDSVMSLAEELRSPGTSACFAASYSRRSCVVLLNAVSSDACAASVLSLQSRLNQMDAVWSWGSSEQVNAPSMLYEAYKHAQKALTYVALDSQSKGSGWNELAKSGVFSLRRPDSLNHLYGSLSVGRVAEAKSSIQDYVSRTVYSGYASRESLCFLHETLMTAFRRLEEEYSLSLQYDDLRAWNGERPNAIQKLYDCAMSACESLQGAMESGLLAQRQSDDLMFLSYLNEHLFDETLSLTVLADHFHVSESVASRRIRALTDLNFLDYVNQKRIEHAGVMLIHSDISINELAKATGYGSDITFRRVFKKYMGMTPSEYRLRRQ